MLNWAVEQLWHWETLWGLFVVALIAFGIYRDKRRRRTLRRREDGYYVWIEWHGGERGSREDPSTPGGAWDSEGGDGGDGGD